MADNGWMKPRRPAAARSFVSPFDRPPEVAPEPEVYELNDRVSHDQHGLGVVSALEGTDAVTVDFGSGERRRVTLPSTKLCRL
jgi:hypothetical protein